MTAASGGLVARLDWLYESPEIDLAQAVGVNLQVVAADWRRADPADLLRRIDVQRGG